MAKQLLFSFNGEGNSDYRFLIKLLERILPQFIVESEKDADLLPIIPLTTPNGLRFVDKINNICNESGGVHALIVHMDADSRRIDSTLNNKWQPFIDQYQGDIKCIPLIPIRNIESWMLCDIDAISDLTDLSNQDISAKINGRMPENISDGKEIIRSILEDVDYDMDDAYFQEGIASRISIEKLNRLRSFTLFKAKTMEAISEMV